MASQSLNEEIIVLSLEWLWQQLGILAYDDLLFNHTIATAFGTHADASTFRTAWAEGDFTGLPAIEIRNSTELNGANGAFAVATSKIYLAQEFIDANSKIPGAIGVVLLEEYGHYIDIKMNIDDSTGDEGYIFAILAQGKSLNELELAALKAEDDTSIISINGNLITAEESNSIIVTNNKNNTSK